MWRSFETILIFLGLFCGLGLGGSGWSCAPRENSENGSDGVDITDSEESEPELDSTTASDSSSVGDTDSSSDTSLVGECGIAVHRAEISPKISTVGIVEWSAPGEVTEAFIEFGLLDEAYAFKAPVGLNEPHHRTLLLGMKTNRAYKYRVVARIDGEECTGVEQTITTGPLATGLPIVDMEIVDPIRYNGGFIVTVTYSDGWVYILDEDGDFVWWYRIEDNLTRARMSGDGRHMLVGDLGMGYGGSLWKIGMDGLSETKVPNIGDRHHDFTVLPEGNTLAFFEYDNTGVSCDVVYEMGDDGSDKRRVFEVRDMLENLSEECHTNAINYDPADESYYVSLRRYNTIIKVGRNGELRWRLGGDESTLVGAEWTVQHQFHVLGDDILIFNNDGGDPDWSSMANIYPDNYPAGGGVFAGKTARIIRVAFDESARTSSILWEYASGRRSSAVLGDVKALPNGNIQFVISTSGVIQEIDPDAEETLVMELKTDSMGYASRRGSLYGGPPEYNYYPHP